MDTTPPTLDAEKVSNVLPFSRLAAAAAGGKGKEPNWLYLLEPGTWFKARKRDTTGLTMPWLLTEFKVVSKDTDSFCVNLFHEQMGEHSVDSELFSRDMIKYCILFTSTIKDNND